MTQDRYKYFRVEARDILDELGKRVLELEAGNAAPDGVGRVLRLAHTLKGAARVVKQSAVADRAHAVEDALAPYRDQPAPIPRERIDQLLALIDEMGRQVASLTTPAGVVESTPRNQPEAPSRPASDDVESLMRGIAEILGQLIATRPSLTQIARAQRLVDVMSSQLARPRSNDGARPRRDTTIERLRSLVEDLRTTLTAAERTLEYGVERMDRELRQVRDTAERLRLTPAGALFTFLELAARDAAKTMGKEVELTTHGQEVRVDTSVLSVVQAALLQMVRNAVAHGIETPDVRAAAGKRPRGRVTLRVTQHGRLVSFACIDDGRGIDVDAVRRIAQQKGVPLDERQTGNVNELFRLLLKGGISTSQTVTEVSGRGIGLDIVREAAARLGGSLTMHTDPGVGTTVELIVPISMASFEGLFVEVAGVTVAVPLEAVRATARVAHDDIVRTETAESILVDGQSIPLASLHDSLWGTASPRLSTYTSAIVVQGKGGVAALDVDRILGTGSVVLRPIPALAPAAPIVGGIALDAEGDPRVVLDPDRLVERAQQAGGRTLGDPRPRLPVLVVDDSLTTRMLERSILESAGYAVDLAVSAEEALTKARVTRYALFLVDVEMPGMDGFSFIERIRADTQLRGIPAILVTSRMSLEDRERGQAVGAQGYIVKSDFDQSVLLERIRTLVS